MANILIYIYIYVPGGNTFKWVKYSHSNLYYGCFSCKQLWAPVLWQIPRFLESGLAPTNFGLNSIPDR